VRITAMEVLGVSVRDLDATVARYSELFGLEFYVLTPRVDYAVEGKSRSSGDPSPLPDDIRIAIDTSGCFELIEMPEVAEGVRNIHFRVDDMDVAVRHMTEANIRVVQDMRVGLGREVIFDSQDLNGVRVCFLWYEGSSFVEALAASPPP
jgi:catechol 2,3-dioxygenase-like lactoylglutathione lyase family enzyme